MTTPQRTTGDRVPFPRPGPQRLLGDAFDVHGYHGVMNILSRLAGERRGQGKSWDTFLDAVSNTPDRVLFYLTSVHHRVLRAVMNGELTKLMCEDVEVRRSVQLHASLTQVPTTYLNVPCRVEFEPGGSTQDLHGNASRHWHGYGASPAELETVTACILHYTAYNDRSTKALAAEVDSAYGMDRAQQKQIEGYKGGRRYLPSGRSVTVLRAWAHAVRSKVIEPARKIMSDEQFREPLPWCFYEVGFGIQGIKRAQMHVRHENTNYLFGLYTAILEAKMPGHFRIEPFSLSTVAKPEEADLSEIQASMYSGAYFIQGTEWIGLNPSLAGGAKEDTISAPKYDKDWTRGRDLLAASKVWDANWTTDRRKRKASQAVWDTDQKLAQNTTLTAELEAKTATAKVALAELQSQVDQRPASTSLREKLRRKASRMDIKEDRELMVRPSTPTLLHDSRRSSPESEDSPWDGSRPSRLALSSGVAVSSKKRSLEPPSSPRILVERSQE